MSFFVGAPGPPTSRRGQILEETGRLCMRLTPRRVTRLLCVVVKPSSASPRKGVELREQELKQQFINALSTVFHKS